ncbi:M23 family metallopeptidase [Nocardia otitidiscaviarum]|uniref:M23 family metallopeptidase n=2 Tax=Nocardiaceae TaxID=85025 RepID=UPI00226BBEAD|nr:M23 family metallopeptidase [Nocardia otitidiscaviarum]
MPVPEGTYSISSGFGLREGGEFHEGVDFAAAAGTPILAAIDGTVVEAGPASGFGNWIVVDTRIGDQVVSTVYGHMVDGGIKVLVGDEISAGQQIGEVGSAGQSSGPHLHFEVVPGGRRQGGEPIDPLEWVSSGSSNSDVLAAYSVQTARPKSSRDRRHWAQAAGYEVGCDRREVVASGPRLQAGVVPEEYEPWILRAATTCAEVTGPILAAQLRQESGFNRFAVSPAGAEGPAQFMPGTWAAHGIDGDGDGRTEVTSIPDAVMSQAAHDCDLAEIAKAGLAEGRLRGDLTELWLSMYNCGVGGTFDSGGVCQNAETLGYVKAIPELAATYAAAGTTVGPS